MATVPATYAATAAEPGTTATVDGADLVENAGHRRQPAHRLARPQPTWRFAARGSRQGPSTGFSHEFGEPDLWDAEYEKRPVSSSIYPVFQSYADLLAHIAAFKLDDGTIIEALPDGATGDGAQE